MLIAHVHDRFSAYGGADWHLISIMNSMPPHYRQLGVFGRKDVSAGRFLFDREPIPQIHLVKKLDKKASFSSEEGVGRRLTQILEQEKPAVIHVHNILNPHLLTVLAKSAPSVMTIQDHRYFCPGMGKVKKDGELCEQPLGLHCAACFDDEDYFISALTLVRARLKALKEFRRIIVLSGYMKKELTDAGMDENKIHVIPPFVYGLDQVESPAAFGKRILFAGRITWSKGIIDLLEALALVDRRFELTVVGRGNMDDEIQEEMRRLGINGRVEFQDWADHGRMSEILRMARVLVLPSRWQEPFGIVGLEAMAQGRPVVAYQSGGISEWLEDGVSGLIVPNGNTLALAAGLNVMMKSGKQATALGREGRKRAAQYSKEKMTALLTAVYESAG